MDQSCRCQTETIHSRKVGLEGKKLSYAVQGRHIKHLKETSCLPAFISLFLLFFFLPICFSCPLFFLLLPIFSLAFFFVSFSSSSFFFFSFSSCSHQTVLIAFLFTITMSFYTCSNQKWLGKGLNLGFFFPFQCDHYNQFNLII